MKKLIKANLWLAILSIGMMASAGEYLKLNTAFTTVCTNTITSNLTASVTYTNTFDCHAYVWHTIQCSATTAGTNVTTVNTDRTSDGATWIPVSTNSVSTNSVFEVSMIGKWQAIRYRVAAGTTNGTVNLSYMGQ
jgi:hypothetical protein